MRVVPHSFRSAYRIYGTILFLLLAASGCAALEDFDRGPKSFSAEPVEKPQIRGLDDFRSACAELNRQLSPANVVYDPEVKMTRGDSSVVAAAVTLDVETPPEQVLAVEDPVARQVLVSCSVEAQLRGAPEEFDIQEKGWQRQHLTTQRTAQWTWFVTPKLGGVHEIVLAVRPVVVITEESGAERGESEATEARYRISVDVSVPLDQWLAEKFDRLTNVVDRAAALTKALTGLLVAITVLVPTIWWRKRQRADNKPRQP